MRCEAQADNQLVSGDPDGDGAADFALLLAGLQALDADSVLL